MYTEFGQILAFIILAIIFVIVSVFFAKLIRPHRPSHEKLLTYECGENPLGSPWIKFNIRFYVIALIFLIFDVEIVLLIPWAVIYQSYGMEGFIAGFVFLFLLGLGMAYEWRKGDLEWERPSPNIPTLDKSENATFPKLNEENKV